MQRDYSARQKKRYNTVYFKNKLNGVISSMEKRFITAQEFLSRYKSAKQRN